MRDKTKTLYNIYTQTESIPAHRAGMLSVCEILSAAA